MYVLVGREVAKQYPGLRSMLRYNTDKLITNEDIYKSISELINPARKVYKNNGINIFTSIVPRNRTCRDANINHEWCNCWLKKT